MADRKFTNSEIEQVSTALNTLQDLECDIDSVRWSKFQNEQVELEYNESSNQFFVNQKQQGK